jgi:hypothetical protein
MRSSSDWIVGHCSLGQGQLGSSRYRVFVYPICCATSSAVARPAKRSTVCGVASMPEVSVVDSTMLPSSYQRTFGIQVVSGYLAMTSGMAPVLSVAVWPANSPVSARMVPPIQIDRTVVFAPA